MPTRPAGPGAVTVRRTSTEAGERVVEGLPRPDTGGRRLTAAEARGVLRSVTDTDVRLWRRVHMDLLRYAGCMCRPSC
ncbi:putative leader peptide [Streptomyces sp. NPDC059071]|uniref:putative leader peptide n=1 Tax=unclassified Streptomyces TaxID=2593676 RepID=UPI003665F750